jgi:hypothetical protein
LRSAQPGQPATRFNPTVPPAWAWACSLLVLALALATQPAWAQYKWRDSRGQVHVSDLPPPREIPDKDVLQRPAVVARAAPAAAPTASVTSAPVASGVAANRAPLDPELEARRKKAELDAKASAKAEEDRQAAQRADNCQRARQQLATLDSGQRLVQFNAKGERTVMDDAARANETAQARRVVATDCR